MKIALCKSGFAGPISGADETMVTYAIELHRAGHDVQVLLLFPFSKKDPYYRRLEAAGIPVGSIVSRAWLFGIMRLLRQLATHFLFIFVLLSRFPGHVRKVWQALLNLISGLYYDRCREYFEKHRFDVMHVFTPESGTAVMIRAGSKAGVPILYQELGTPQYLPGSGASYDRLAKVTPFCTELAALSPRLARQWTDKLPHAEGIRVLPLAVSLPAEVQIPRRSTPYDVIFGFAARVEAGKGPIVLIEAFAEVSRRLERAYLRIAGVGPQIYKARSRTRELGLAESCEFAGRYTGAEGRAAFMQTIDIFVLPTFAEGTPNGIIEAMAAGVPTIASGVGGIPDMIIPETGILVPPGEPMALASAMVRLARDPELRAQMGRAARNRYEQLFSPAAVMPVLLETYRRVAAKGAPQAAAAATAPQEGPVPVPSRW